MKLNCGDIMLESATVISLHSKKCTLYLGPLLLFSLCINYDPEDEKVEP